MEDSYNEGMNWLSMSLRKSSSMAGLSFIADQCINPQDALIIQLYVEGVDIHEIVYLRKDSLEFATRTISITDGKRVVRRQRVSPKCAELFHYAIRQTKYFLNNGMKQSESAAIRLKETAFAIKPSLHDFVANEAMILEMDSIILRTIYHRCRTLADVFNMPELAYLTTAANRSAVNESLPSEAVQHF
jgi:hypothetical protein